MDMHVDTLIDDIHCRIDRWLRNGDYEACDKLMREMDVDVEPTDTLLSVLTATLPARSKLSARAEFVDRVEQQIGDNLLEGLV